MTCEKKPPFLVQAVYSFKGQNNDELCFKKNDVFTVTQIEDGGWWEGTFKEKIGWFPSNYVEEYKADSCGSSSSGGVTLASLSKSCADLHAQQTANRTIIIKDLVDSEKAHVTELENLLIKFLTPIKCSPSLKPDEYNALVGNIAEVIQTHETLLKNLIDCSTLAPEQQRIGRLFLSSAPKLMRVHEKYCASHPNAVLVLEKYRDELNKLMEANGAAAPGTLVLVAGLSKPFRRLDKYDGILQELKRYMEESHVDRGDVSRSVSVYKDMATSCLRIRRQKELELQIVVGGIRGWEGDDLSTMGPILRVGSVAIGPQLKDRYLVLFPAALLILSVSSNMTSFVYEGKLPLTGIRVSKLEQHSTAVDDSFRNAFIIKGPMIEEIVAICQTKEDRQLWINDISKQIETASSSSRKQQQSSTSDCSVSVAATAAATNVAVPTFSVRCPSPNAANDGGGVPKPQPPPHGAATLSATKNQIQWKVTKLRPSPPMRCNFWSLGTKLQQQQQSRHSSKLVESTFTEDARVLQVIESYCASAKLRYTIGSAAGECAAVASLGRATLR